MSETLQGRDGLEAPLRPSRRPTGRLTVTLLLVAIAVVGWVVIRNLRRESAAEAAFPLQEGRIAVAGISGPVEIYRDDRGIPHVEASRELDAFFGFGFVHAQDRLGEMVWLMLSARGRTAEFMGAEGLAADRWARTLDFGGLADAQYERLDASTKALLIAYSAGVNARIERIRVGRVAPPLSLRRGKLPAELWRPADCLAIAKLFSWGLADTVDVSLVLRDISIRLGGRAAAPFFPGGAALTDPNRPPGTVTASAQHREPFASGGPIPGLARLRAAVGLDGRNVGSSAWVLSGRATESGHVILAADSHLEPTAPALFHIAQVRGGSFDVAGAALPGVPIFWTGHNRHLAWASTHARVVTVDLHEETLGSVDPDQYNDGSGWRALAHRSERIAIAGGGEEILDVRSTRHGPLIDTRADPAADADAEPLSLAWVGALEELTNPIPSMLRIARAVDARALRRAFADHHDPPLTIAYAVRNGPAGVQLAGWVPKRALPAGLVPLPGRARWYDWSGRVPFDRLPREALGGSRRWAIAADNILFKPGRTGEIDWLWRPGVRAERIDTLLRAQLETGPIDLRRMATLQSDVGSQRAVPLIATALEVAGTVPPLSVEAQDIAQLLGDWNGESTAGSVGAAAYHVFIEGLAGELFELLLGEELTTRYRGLRQIDREQVVFDLLRLGTAGQLGEATDSDQLREAIRESLRRTWLQLSFRLGANREKWRWGWLHRLQFRSFAPPRAEIGALGPFPLGGSGASINTAEFVGDESFSVQVASTFRMVVDVGSLDQALTAIAPGESEHPGHPHYRDGLDDWLAGHSDLFVTDRMLVRESAAQRLLIEALP